MQKIAMQLLCVNPSIYLCSRQCRQKTKIKWHLKMHRQTQRIANTHLPMLMIRSEFTRYIALHCVVEIFAIFGEQQVNGIKIEKKRVECPLFAIQIAYKFI